MNDNKSRQQTNYYAKIFITIIIVILVVTYFIGYIFQDSIVFKQIGSTDGWLAFTGAIVGSCLTLLGVIKTLEVQESKRKEDKAAEYKPIPIFKLHPTSCNIDTQAFHKVISQIDKNVGVFVANIAIEVKNVGRAEMLNFEITDIKLIVNQKALMFSQEKQCKSSIEIIPKDYSVLFEFEKKMKYCDEQLSPFKDIVFTLEINYSYENIYHDRLTRIHKEKTSYSEIYFRPSIN